MLWKQTCCFTVPDIIVDYRIVNLLKIFVGAHTSFDGHTKNEIEADRSKHFISCFGSSAFFVASLKGMYNIGWCKNVCVCFCVFLDLVILHFWVHTYRPRQKKCTV